MRGRVADFDPVAARKIVKEIRVGIPIDLAADGVDISKRRLARWLEKGRAGEKPYQAFVARCEAAEQAAIDANLAVVKAAARDGKQGAKAWLAALGISEDD